MINACGEDDSPKKLDNTELETEEVEEEQVCNTADQTGTYTVNIVNTISGTCVLSPFQIVMTGGVLDFGIDCTTTSESLDNNCHINSNIVCENPASDFIVKGDLSLDQTSVSGQEFKGTFIVELTDISTTPVVVLCNGEYDVSLLRY